MYKCTCEVCLSIYLGGVFKCIPVKYFWVYTCTYEVSLEFTCEVCLSVHLSGMFECIRISVKYVLVFTCEVCLTASRHFCVTSVTAGLHLLGNCCFL